MTDLRQMILSAPAEFCRCYGQRNLTRMVQFAEVFPDPKILLSLMTKLGWKHFPYSSHINEIVKGKRALTVDTALRLERSFGWPAGCMAQSPVSPRPANCQDMTEIHPFPGL